MSAALILAAALTNLSGVVSFEREGLPFYFLRDDNGASWRIERLADPVLSVGDRILVTGEREPSSVKNRLTTQTIVRLERTPEERAQDLDRCAPREVTIPELFDNILPFGNSEWYGDRFTTEGILRDINRRQTTTQLLVGEGDRNIQVEMPWALETALPANLVQGATVRVTGALAYTSIENYEEALFGRIENIELIPMSGEDVAVIKRAPEPPKPPVPPPPPYWTGRRVASIFGIAGGVVVAILGILSLWVTTLRRMVRKRTQELAESIRERETTRIEADAARRERLRLAADLHDGFQQYLAGAMFRLKAARNYLPKDAVQSREQLEKVHDALQHTQAGLRSTLWAMNEESEGPESLMALFSFAARRMAHWEGKVEITSEGEERSVARKSAGTLLLIMQEAVGNALKHGSAEHVRVRLKFGEGTFILSVIDDGSGFDPSLTGESGHYGMSSMERRCTELGGTMSVWSKRRLGTRLDFTIPCA